MILCKVYQSGHGSNVPAPPRCASARKRKADGVQHPDEVPTTARQRQRQQQKKTTEDEEAMLFAQRLESEMQQMSEEDDDAMLFAQILESEMDLLRDHEAEHLPGGKEHAAPEEAPPADDDEVMEISLDEFLGSSAPHAAPTCCTAAQQENAAASCLVQTSQHEQSATDSDVIKVIPEKLMSAPSPLTDDYDDDDMCGLACPPMDDDYVELMLSEPLVQFFDQALVGEFISDL